jgi:NTE family protein
MATAFVLSGGGSLGAVQVGMLQALAERHIQPDFLVGTSAGALNAAYVGAHGTTSGALERLASIWAHLRRRDVFPLEPLRPFMAAMGAAPSLCSNEPLRRLIQKNLPYRRLEDAAIPVHVLTTDICTGKELLLSEGDAVDAVLASAAIPAVFPAIAWDDVFLADGGLANNAAIAQAIGLGADRVYVLPTGYACALEEPPTTALASALHALTLLIEQRLILEVTHLAGDHDVRVLPPLCPLTVTSIDFRHGAELIVQARETTGQWLDDGGTSLPHPERFLALHAHATNGSCLEGAVA